MKILLAAGCFILIGGGCFSNTHSENQPNGYYWSSDYAQGSIQCEFKYFQSSEFSEKGKEYDQDTYNKKIHNSTDRQDNPTVINFLNIETDSPEIVGNNGSSELVKLKDNDEVIVMAEDNSTGVFIYTLYKKHGVMVWSKSYTLLWMPYSYQSMGYCK